MDETVAVSRMQGEQEAVSLNPSTALKGMRNIFHHYTTTKGKTCISAFKTFSQNEKESFLKQDTISQTDGCIGVYKTTLKRSYLKLAGLNWKNMNFHL